MFSQCARGAAPRTLAPPVFFLFFTLAGADRGAAALLTFQDDLTGFNLAAASPPVSIDFDDLAAGTNLAGATISGITFSSPDGNRLEVVEGLSTFTPPGFTGVIDADTNRLFPTSGDHVLSPGGPELVPGPDLAEMDSLQIDFASPVSAFGIDVLFQSLDTATFTSFRVFGPSLTLLAAGPILGVPGAPGGAAGGSTFIGFVSTDPSTDILRIVFIDGDGNNIFPDANIGFDTLRFVPPPAVSEPAALAFLLTALIAAACIRRR